MRLGEIFFWRDGTVGKISNKEADQFKRKMLIFLIFAPGIFFIVYWLYTQTSDRVGVPTVKIPVQYVLLGQQVDVNGEHYVARGGEPVFSETLDLSYLSKNVAVAEPGRVFVGLALVTDAKFDRDKVQIIDALGCSYSPLDVEQAVVARNFKLPGNENHLYLFKVNSRADYYFMQLNGDARLTWRFENSYAKKP